MRLSFYFFSFCFLFVDFSIHSWNSVLNSIEFPYTLKNGLKDGVCAEKKKNSGNVGASLVLLVYFSGKAKEWYLLQKGDLHQEIP